MCLCNAYCSSQCCRQQFTGMQSCIPLSKCSFLARCSIHWHGFKMKTYNWYDGVAHVSQCPIKRGSSFTYRFKASGHTARLVDASPRPFACWSTPCTMTHLTHNDLQNLMFLQVNETPGTYFWHDHSSLNRADGLQGAMIVRPANGTKELYSYDDERTLFVMDLWHLNANAMGMRLNRYTALHGATLLYFIRVLIGGLLDPDSMTLGAVCSLAC